MLTQPVWLQSMGFYAQLTLPPPLPLEPPSSPPLAAGPPDCGGAEEGVLTWPRWWSWAAGTEGANREGIDWRCYRWIDGRVLGQMEGRWTGRMSPELSRGLRVWGFGPGLYSQGASGQPMGPQGWPRPLARCPGASRRRGGNWLHFCWRLPPGSPPITPPLPHPQLLHWLVGTMPASQGLFPGACQRMA